MNRRSISIREWCKDLWFPPAPTVRTTLPKRETPVRPDGWSRRALHEATSARFALFFTGRKPADRKRRAARLHRWSWALRKRAAKARLERFGLDVTGHGAADVRRVMRNARKAERA